MKNIFVLFLALLAGTVYGQKPLEPFSHLRTFGNVQVVLTKGDSNSYTAERNIDDLKISVENGRLKISHKQNNKMWSEKTVVEVTYIELHEIYASAGSEIVHEATLEGEEWELSFDSGASARLNVDAISIVTNVGEGAVLKLTGTCKYFEAAATTGGVLKAMDLEANIVTVRANTGAQASVHAVEKIEAKASMGGMISYSGNPEFVKTTETMGGSIRG